VLAASLAGDIARIGFGLALLAAGVAKIGHGRAWTAQAAANQVPTFVARAVPWLELTTGAAVVSGVGSPWPSVAGVALMAAFTVWIVVQLAADRHPPCACFGALSDAPLSWRHGARNAALIIVGIVAVVA
jgi:uncharacterized membrane protein YphA (DoxX/SURF4 family)